MLAFMRSVANMYVLGDPPNYTPPGDQRLDAARARLGVTPLELAYDLLVSGDGRTILFHPGANYTDASDANMASMLRHDHTVMALGDGGAHYGLICDASYTTHALTYWTRDRRASAGPCLGGAAAHRRAGAPDRARRPRPAGAGYKADINVIDLDNLRVAAPHPVHNLPGGGRRLEQKAEGYRATIAAARSPTATASSPARYRAGWCAAPGLLPERMKLLLTHVPRARQQYYGARALARLQELVEVTLHEARRRSIRQA
jgi:N-acyl-D-aspartate/D-glutamate deacylase